MTVKVPKGLVSAIADNHHLSKVVAVFLHLKAINKDNSGRITEFRSASVRNQIAAELHVSIKTLYHYIEILENINLVTRHANGMLQLASYEALRTHCGALPIAGFYLVEYNECHKFIYSLKALYWRESEDRQRYRIRQKAQIWMERQITSGSQLQTAIDWQMLALKSCFAEARTPEASEHLFDPDTAVSTRTAAKHLGCYWHTSATYWQQKLERMKLITVERNRYVPGTTKSYSSPLSHNGVFWSNAERTRLAQLPNSVKPFQSRPE